MKPTQVTRRDFMKTVGAAGMGSMLATGRVLAQDGRPAAANPKVPSRPFGKTGVNVSMLALGGIFDIAANQLVLQRALDFGVTYWDTAEVYVNGNSEKGIGMYLEKHPEVRKQIFLVSKAGGSHSTDGLNRSLNQSLERLKTDYIDLYFLHGIRGGRALSDEVKAWAEKTKASGKIRLFGFSTHGGMEETLEAAAKLGWVDGLMLKYDFRLMQTDAMRAALDASAKAGIGLTAMKTQGGGPLRAETEADLKLGGHFIRHGFTDKQAKLKAVWENPQVAAICSQMGSISVLESNVAAALDKTKLTAADHSALKEYAQETGATYCAGCTHLCEAALNEQVPVGELMRCLMYHRVYGDAALAREVFAALPADIRKRLPRLECAAAERVCPQRLPIGRLVREAHGLLA
jgi:uncharacterized protein